MQVIIAELNENRMTDRELVEDILKRGRTQCFADIVRRYSGMVYSKALSVVHRDELAAEVVQQTFVKAYERLDVWRGQELGPWLVVIAMHTALHVLEKEKRHRTYPMEEVSDVLTDSFDEEREELIQRMEQAIERLPESEQDLLHRHYYQQQKTADIARQTGLSQPNVLVKLHRIREKLRGMLGT